MTAEKSFEDKIPEALEATGFVVEHEVSEAFRAAGWGVIGSRYYIDDVDGKARELDLIAYKVTSGPEIDVVTTILISCKKDRENAWAVMSRKRPFQDPNLDWNPIHTWTNNGLLGAYLGSSKWSDEYVRSDNTIFSALFEIERQAFAFQLISKNSCRPKNDRPIFESLTDLMKAQDHELSILPDRMKKKRIYIFNLVAVVDAALYEVRYDEMPAVATEVQEFRHLARYIVRRQERVARINICSKNKIFGLVNSYELLAKHDAVFFNIKIKEAYDSLPRNRAVQRFLGKQVEKKLKWNVWAALGRNHRKRVVPEIGFQFDSQKNELVVLMNLDDDDLSAIFIDELLIEETRTLLASEARYVGSFRFEVDIPF